MRLSLYAYRPERISLLLDEGTFQESDANLTSADPLGFKGPKTYRIK